MAGKFGAVGSSGVAPLAPLCAVQAFVDNGMSPRFPIDNSPTAQRSRYDQRSGSARQKSDMNVGMGMRRLGMVPGSLRNNARGISCTQRCESRLAQIQRL